MVIDFGDGTEDVCTCRSVGFIELGEVDGDLGCGGDGNVGFSGLGVEDGVGALGLL